MSEYEAPTSDSGKVRRATSVEIDPARWRAAWYRRRLTLVMVSEMAGKSRSWANQMANKGQCSYFAIDRLAAELEEVTDELLYEVASDRERERMDQEPWR